MAIKKINIETFLRTRNTSLVLDVRTPAEFDHAHIPNAKNLPIFTNEQRKEIGTTYKQVSRQEAIDIGLKYFGPQLLEYTKAAKKLLKESACEQLIVHCWRGGMRSAAMAWLLDLYGFNVSVLVGGYKCYRKWALAQFEKKYPIKILGGYTGSGKSYVLPLLQNETQAIIDLEGLACHKGSAFGAIGMPKAPSQEQFENILGLQLFEKISSNPRIIFLEDESQRIGNLLIPNPIWQQMREAKVYFLDIPFEARLDHICKEYGNLPIEALIDATTRITKRLGGLEAKNCAQFLQDHNTKDAFAILLKYYDKYYCKALLTRQNTTEKLLKLESNTVDAIINANTIKEAL